MKFSLLKILLLVCVCSVSAQKIKLKKKDGRLYVDKVHYGKLIIEDTDKNKKRLILEDLEGTQVVVAQPMALESLVYHDDKTFEYSEISFPSLKLKVGLRKEDLTWSRDEIIKFLAKYNVMNEGMISEEGVELMLEEFPNEVPVEITEKAQEEADILTTITGKVAERDSSGGIIIIFNRTTKKDNETYVSEYSIIQDKVTIGKAVAETSVVQLFSGRGQDVVKPTVEADPKIYYYSLEELPIGSLQIGKDGEFRSYFPFKKYASTELNFNEDGLGILLRIQKGAEWLVNNGNL